MSCLYCPPGAESCLWCSANPPRIDGRARFPGASVTQACRAQSGHQHAQGHPMPALVLVVAAETCGTCAHKERHTGNAEKRVYLKCALGPKSFGGATDIRARWPACSRWTP